MRSFHVSKFPSLIFLCGAGLVHSHASAQSGAVPHPSDVSEEVLHGAQQEEPGSVPPPAVLDDRRIEQAIEDAADPRRDPLRRAQQADTANPPMRPEDTRVSGDQSPQMLTGAVPTQSSQQTPNPLGDEDDDVVTELPPVFRLRVGGGAGAPTAGDANLVLGRVFEEFEYLPNDATPFVFGLSFAQDFGAVWFTQWAARAGMQADIGSTGDIKWGAVLAIHAGLIAGGLNRTFDYAGFDFEGNFDVRAMFNRGFEVSARAGFYIAQGVPVPYGTLALGYAFGS